MAYNAKTDWKYNDTPTENDLNRIEQGIKTLDQDKAPSASPALTGTPTVPTAAVDTSTQQAASTAFVVGQASTTAPDMNGTAAVGTSKRYARADHVHPTDTTRAPLASPTFTGSVTLPGNPTAALQAAPKQYVDTVQSNLTAHIGTGGTSHAAATTSAAGFMSATDKTKLDGLTAGAGGAGSATDSVIGNRTVSDATTPSGDTGTVTTLFGWLANMIKAITGGATWRTAPVKSLAALNTEKAPIASPTFTGTAAAPTFVSTAATGTSPMTVASTTAVTNLNADMVDGYHVSIAGTANNIPFNNGTLMTNLNADMVDGFQASTSSTAQNTIAVRDSNAIVNAVQFAATVADGNPPFIITSKTLSANLNADMVDGYHFNQDLRTTASPSFSGATFAGTVTMNAQIVSTDTSEKTFKKTNANTDMGFYVNDSAFGAYDWKNTKSVFDYNKSNGTFSFGVTVNAARFTSTQATGTAPFTVNSQTTVANLNADLLDGKHASEFIAQPTTINSGTNLNDIQTPGFYYCPANATVATLANTPTAMAFSLLVERHAGTKQTLTAYPADTTSRTWYRNYYSGTWGPWTRIWTGNDLTISGTAPLYPNVGDVWIDTSV
ncbi:pyocin knob domain-containing protein [Cohnella sp. GCM10020058]|uniref:pyocin knob domain-containing protein n=1 Tax=Cohnella sp. GCM10020058 TaxID=3317330 RepID=UPI00362519A0